MSEVESTRKVLAYYREYVDEHHVDPYDAIIEIQQKLTEVYEKKPPSDERTEVIKLYKELLEELRAKLSPKKNEASKTETLVFAGRLRKDKIRIQMDVTQDVSEFMDMLADENGTTKVDVMRRAIALLRIAHEQKQQKRSLGFVSNDRKHLLETVVVGVL